MILNQVSRLGHSLAILVLVASVLVRSPHGAEAGLWTPDVNECAFLADINAYRKAYGLRPLSLSRTLSTAADNHSRYMARTDDIDHTLGSLSWSANIRQYGYPSDLAIGENVLAGRQSAGGALVLWESSYAHNQNMLNANWRAIGIARAVNLDGTYRFYWTTTFGAGTDETISC
jgi:uncharacterized protein YkwD